MTNPARSTYDIVVIGGGIHGVGVLQAAAARGHRALLLESNELAAGTSSRSSKLIHGGLRYLESGQLGLVRESLTEREILCRIAPHLVRLVPFFVPIYRETSRRPWKIRAGLSLYALLGGLAKDAWFRRVPRRDWDGLDGLQTEGLQHVFRYFDGQTDDALLTRAVAASAIELGAEVRVPARFESARRNERGYRIAYSDAAARHEVETTVVVNAAGPWVEHVRRGVEPSPPGFEVELVAGTHIELDVPTDAGIYYCEAPSDRRAVFTMPWHGRSLVGTTETIYDGDPRRVEPTRAEIDYLTQVHRHYFPDKRAELRDAWAGLRVLPKASGSAFDRPRETTLVVDQGEIHYLAIYGGKLTGYRATAEKVLDRLAPSLPQRPWLADTAKLTLPEPSF
ncbi:MAG: glycerol-3-phosphate dehydrogenase/oxidase [Planctomycetes bacterium]|nr:glycerol-3-phosphate dehydrogenase/oxidase [Planctomycetota bacterium]MCB9918378.1 glycerol-3-phosphate dehydrogenase/oxidase [Planctomycetota bacterium]